MKTQSLWAQGIINIGCELFWPQSIARMSSCYFVISQVTLMHRFTSKKKKKNSDGTIIWRLFTPLT